MKPYEFMNDSDLRAVTKHYIKELNYAKRHYDDCKPYIDFLKDELGSISLILNECWDCGNTRDFVVFFKTKSGTEYEGLRCFHCNTILNEKVRKVE